MTFITDEGLKIEAKYHKSWGMQTEYDRFWDGYQENGNRVNYGDAFAYWNDEVFNPKYPLNNLTLCYRMFANFNTYSGRPIVDLVELCERKGIDLDFSNALRLAPKVSAILLLSASFLLI